MIKCCIFDMDGTLLDTLVTIEHYLNITLEEFGLPLMREDECRRYVGRGAKNLVTQTLNARLSYDEEYFNRFYEKYSESYDNAPDYLTEPYDGICELIDELLLRGIKIGVLSNKPHSATEPIVRKFFGDKISYVSGGKDGVPLKPAPDGVYLVLGELGFDKSQCMYIGDSEIDVYTAKAAEVELPVAVSWGFRTHEELIAAGAKTIIDSPEKILSLLK